MRETVERISLPVDEQLIIEKNHVSSGEGARISIVSGIHGDELDGQYICYELLRRMQERPECLRGTVDVYPMLNPLGMDSVERGFPPTGTDMNSVFPGTMDGILMENVAAHIVDDLVGSDLCIDVHSSNVFLQELPQVRVLQDWEDKLLPYAKRINGEFVWIQETDSALEATFSYAMNCVGVPAITVEMGVGMYITRNHGDRIVDGIFAVMQDLGIWDGPVAEVSEPMLVHGSDLERIKNDEPGVFLPSVSLGEWVAAGQVIGEIVSSLEGRVLEQITSIREGRVSTLRKYPLVYKGSLIARVITAQKGGQ